MMEYQSRREFLKVTTCLAGASLLNQVLPGCAVADLKNEVEVSAHLWEYARKFPPHWDCTPILDTVFSDYKYAGIGGIEMMEVIIRRKDAVQNIGGLIKKHGVKVSGISYYADMWDKNRHSEIIDDVELVTDHMRQLGATEFGITTGFLDRKKTEEELDNQAELINMIIKVCDKNAVRANIHNHTNEVQDNMYELKGIIKRIPDVKLGPDFNWLIRAGVDPVEFIHTYGPQIVYMHLRDQTADGIRTEALGEGVTNFPAIAKALNEVNFKGSAAIELTFDKPAMRPMKEDLKISRDYVSKIFGW